MKILKCEKDKYNINIDTRSINNKPNVNFKSGFGAWALNSAGGITQGIQNGGFLVSFLIQDCLGMTAPRVGAAFLRDSDVTGQLNMQEGFEVLGREGLSGPTMMAIAPIVFAIAAIFGKSTGINTQLIKRFGNNLKELVKHSDKSLLKDSKQLKKAFYRNNIEQMLQNTLGKENFKTNDVDYIMEQLSRYELVPPESTLKKFNGKKKYQNQCIENIATYINDIKYSTSNELNLLNKVKIGSNVDKVEAYSTKDAIEAMIKYSTDAISKNKNLSELSEENANKIKNTALTKRLFANIATFASTLGILSLLPKLYLKSNVSPGARTAQLIEQQENKEKVSANNVENVNFKGKYSNSIFNKIGEFISKHTNNGKLTSEFEYNGHNFTNTLMTCLSLGGLMPPRIKRALERAQVDENGKKDKTEVYETLIRDISSTLAVVFAVPMLTRAAVTAYEKNTGYVLLEKDRTKSKSKAFLDLLNPYSNVHVLTNKEIDAIYNNINTQDKMNSFCEYIDKNGGDLQKIISKSDKSQELLANTTISKSKLANLSTKEKNIKIKEFFKTFNKKEADKFITSLMHGTGNAKTNRIFAHARGLNSIPTIITTFLISPYILGWVIPRLTYANTRRLHENAKKEKQQNVNATA